MSAKTRRKKTEETVGALTLLFLTVIDIIRKGNRSERMISQLRWALQLIKENRLAVVLAGRVKEGVPSNIQDLLSLSLDSVGLSARAMSQVTSMIGSARYVGDLLVPWTSREYVRQGLKFSEELRLMLGELGIPLDLPLEDIDGNGTEWDPPYANDPRTLASWAQPFHEHKAQKGRSCQGCVSYGELIRRDRRYGPYVPRSWEAPEIPAEACIFYGRGLLAGLNSPALSESVDSLELSVRAANGLKELRILLIRDLVVCTEAELLRSRCIGRKSLIEIREALLAKGLQLGMSSN